MIQGLIDHAKEIAEEFVASGQDIFAMTAKVGEEQVTVSIKFSPREHVLTNDEIFEMLFPVKH